MHRLQLNEKKEKFKKKGLRQITRGYEQMVNVVDENFDDDYYQVPQNFNQLFRQNCISLGAILGT